MRVFAWPRSPRKITSWPASRAFSSCGSTVSLVAEHAVEQRLTGGDPGDGVGPDLVLDRARLPSGRAQLRRGWRDGAAHGSTLTDDSLAAASRRRASARSRAPIRLAARGAVRDRGEARRAPTTSSAATASASTSTTDDWPEVAVPGHWRSHPKFADERRAAALPPPLRAGRRPRPGGAAGSRSTASSTRPTSGSTAPTSATRRATSSRTASTSPRCRRLGDEHVLAVEVTCSPEQGSQRPAQHHRRCSSTPRRSTATGTPAGCGDRSSSTTPARCASTGCGCSAATPTRPGPTCASHARLDTDVARTVRRAHDRRRRGRRRDRARRSPPASTRSSGRSTSTSPALWWPRALGDQPLTDIGVEVLVDGERQRPPLAPHRAARGRVVNDWICSVNGERLFLKGANLLPTRPGLADATPAEVRARRRAGRRGRARRPARAGPHRRPRAVRRRRRARRAAAAGLPAAVGLRPPDPPRGRAPGARGGRPARPPPVDRAVVRPRRAGRRRPAGRGPKAGSAGCAASSRQQLPSWNRSVLDRWVKRAFEQADPTRPTVAHSGVPPTCRSSTAPTATSASAGTAARSATSPSAARAAAADWCASSASSAPSRCRTRPTSSSTRGAGPTSTGSASPSTTASRST